MESVLEQLTRLGFEPVTEWVMKGSKIGPPSFAWQDHGGWLYAFVVDAEVKYIGLTDRVLRSRMSDYAHITHKKNSQTTRLRLLIMEQLASGRRVEVYGKREANKAGLALEEARLLRVYKPAWNRA